MNPTILRAGAPDELLSLVPYLLGFPPEDSLVVLALRGTRVAFTARLDLTSAAMVDAARVSAIARANESDRLVLVAYGDDLEVARDLIDLFVQLSDPLLGVEESYVVSAGAYWCVVPGCGCAANVPFDPSSTATAAAAVLAGLRVTGSRAELAEVVQAPVEPRRSQVEDAYDRVGPKVAELSPEQARDRLALTLEEFLLAPHQLTLDECAELSMLVTDPQVRDVAITRVGSADAAHHVDLWGQVARSSADPFSVAPISLAGLAAWVSGDGALLNVCIERGEECDHEFSLLSILRDISDAGVPPQEWESLRAELKALA